MEFEVITNSVDETISLGEKIGSQLKGGEIFAICGPLGSGKTQFVKGVAKGAGSEDVHRVNSPTFVIVNEYSGRLDIYHIDAYRLNTISEFEMIGFDDLCYSGSVVLIEWADKVENILRQLNIVRIKFEHNSPTCRKIQFKGIDSRILI